MEPIDEEMEAGMGGMAGHVPDARVGGAAALGLACVTATVAPAGMRWGDRPTAAAWPLVAATVSEASDAPVAQAWPLVLARAG